MDIYDHDEGRDPITDPFRDRELLLGLIQEVRHLRTDITHLRNRLENKMTELSLAMADLVAADQALPARIADAINRAVADALSQLTAAQATIAELQAHNASDDNTIAADEALLADLQGQIASAVATAQQVAADLNAQAPEPPAEPTA